MNRLFWLIAIILLGALALASCGGDDDDDDDDDDSSGPEDVYTDAATNLTWQNSEGDIVFTWDKAIAYCDNLVWAGYDDWRMPTIDELRSLIVGCDATAMGGECDVLVGCASQECWSDACYGCVDLYDDNPDICLWNEAFKASCDWHWSSTVRTGDEDDIWGLSFNGGLIIRDTLYNHNLTKCVRP